MGTPDRAGAPVTGAAPLPEVPEVPEHVVDAAIAAVGTDPAVLRDARRGAGVLYAAPRVVRVALAVGGPLVAAARFEGFADDLEDLRGPRIDSWDTGWHCALDKVQELLRARAASLAEGARRG